MAAAAASSAPATKLAETGATGLCSVGVSSTTLKDFNTGLAACEKMLPIVGDLYRANIVVYFCKVSLAGRAPLDTMSLHEFACRHFDAGARPTESLAIVTALAKLKPGLKPWRFDVGFARARFAVRQGARNVVGGRSRS